MISACLQQRVLPNAYRTLMTSQRVVFGIVWTYVSSDRYCLLTGTPTTPTLTLLHNMRPHCIDDVFTLLEPGSPRSI